MALIVWNSTLSVDVAVLDQQHQELVALINRFHDGIKEGVAQQLLEEILLKLVEYTEFHFREEEALMEQYGYPELEHHRSEHLQLVKQVQDVADQFKNGRSIQPIMLMQFLVNWLTNHLKGEDRNYAPFFAAKGVV